MLPSGGELLLIALVVLVLFGGKEMPKIFRTMGKWTATFRRALNDVRREFNQISIEEELKAERAKWEKELEAKDRQREEASRTATKPEDTSSEEVDEARRAYQEADPKETETAEPGSDEAPGREGEAGADQPGGTGEEEEQSGERTIVTADGRERRLDEIRREAAEYARQAREEREQHLRSTHPGEEGRSEEESSEEDRPAGQAPPEEAKGEED